MREPKSRRGGRQVVLGGVGQEQRGRRGSQDPRASELANLVG